MLTQIFILLFIKAKSIQLLTCVQHCFVIIHSWHDTTNQLSKHPAIVRHNHSTFNTLAQYPHLHSHSHRLSHSDHNERRIFSLAECELKISRV